MPLDCKQVTSAGTSGVEKAVWYQHGIIALRNIELPPTLSATR